MNRRGLFKRVLGLGAAAVIAKRLVPEPEALALPEVVPLVPQPLPMIPFGGSAGGTVGPIWVYPYWQTFSGCPACLTPSFTSAAHTHHWLPYTTPNNTAAVNTNIIYGR